MARKKATPDNPTSDSATESKTTKTTKAKAPAAESARKPAARRSTRSARPAADPQATAAPAAPEAKDGLPWKRIDLHIHTPGSHDYEEPDKTYLDILRQAERRGLSMIAFTDHNTVNGFRNMMNEVEHLEYLEKLDRIRPDELGRLNEYRRLLKKIQVLPGFEFTATFGFHILGIFPPDKPLRDIERVLMDLRVPGHVLDKGLTEAGATSDVLRAYQLIDEAGGIAIAAHANSSNGVSMRGLNLGGQTRIAFTQDPHLHAIEFTDLDRGRYSSAHLFTGIKPEYPRRMFAVQGSDAHRIAVAKENSKRLGVGERTTEIQLDEVSFRALRDLFLSQDFARVRPAIDVLDIKADTVSTARLSGASATAAFHAALPKRGDRFEAVLRDVVALTNGEGGVVFIGADANPNKKASGVSDAADAAQKLATEIAGRVAPRVNAQVTVEREGAVEILSVQVPRGDDAPYTIDGAFVVRDGTETRAATRDEIVALARRGYEKPRPPEQGRGEQQRGQQQGGQQRQPGHERQQHRQGQPQQQHGQDRRAHEQRGQQGRGHEQQPSQQPQGPQQPQQQQRQPQQQQQPRRQPEGQRQGRPNEQRQPQRAVQPAPAPEAHEQKSAPVEAAGAPAPAPEPKPAPVGGAGAGANGKSPEPIIPGMPRTGVQVMAMEERNGVQYFTVRDLRNNSTIRNVTKKSARDLWHYAITQFAEHPDGPADIDWQGERAVLAREMRAGKMRSDLAMRDAGGKTVVFYGATDDGLDTTWRDLIAAFMVNRVTPDDEANPEASHPDDADAG